MSPVIDTTRLFFVRWDGPSQAEVEHYQTKLMVGGTIIHNNTVSNPYSHCFIERPSTSSYTIFVHTFNLCGEETVQNMTGKFSGKAIMLLLTLCFHFY